MSAKNNYTLSEILEQENFTIKVPNQYIGIRIDIALAEIITDLSRSKLTNWIKSGHILINHKLIKPKDKILGNEVVMIIPPFNESELNFKTEEIPLNIVYQDESIIIINKPANLTVHPGAGNLSGTLLNGLLYNFPELINIPRAGIVHRLDKDTTGLMVVARNLASQISLAKQLQERSINRVYRAFVEGYPLLNGVINKNIGRDPHNRIKMTTLIHGGREAITHYCRLIQFDKIAYIECRLQTGRTHQIRVHMKDQGFPLIGDPAYGSRKINYPENIVDAIKNLNRQALHAVSLSLRHPSSLKLVRFKIGLPDDLKNLFDALKHNNLPDNLNIDDDYDDFDDNEVAVIYPK